MPQNVSRDGMQAEVPHMPQYRQEPDLTLQQLHATVNSLQPKLQDAMQQAVCSASQALPEVALTPTLRRLQHHIMSSQTAPGNGMHVCAS